MHSVTDCGLDESKLNKVDYISRLTYDLPPEKTGNKARSLIFLGRNKFRVPLTYILSSDAYSDNLRDGNSVKEKLKDEISLLPQISFAIRSSTCAEDSDRYSFAGQFQTVTDVSGSENILKAIETVWDSARSGVTGEYNATIREPYSDLSCAVIIQQMVHASLAGVSFSLNPVTGVNELVIEAVEGPGEMLVQNGSTPLRWRIKENRIIEGAADFSMMNVINQIARDTLAIRKKFGHHADIEWAYDGKEIWYLQVRKITGSGHLSIYSNKLAGDMLPGQIKPLVWSVNIPLVNGTWIKLLSEITGKLDVKPEELSKSFYYRFYLNMTELDRIFRLFGMAAGSLESMMGKSGKGEKNQHKPGLIVFRHTFRIIRFLWSKVSFEKTFIREYGSLSANFESIARRIPNADSAGSFRSLYTELFRAGQRIAYLNIVVPVLMRIHNNKLSKKLSATGADYNLLDFDEDFPLLSSLSPLGDIERIKRQIDELPEDIRSKCITWESFANFKETRSIAEDMGHFMHKFGHLSEIGTDFSVSKWEEDPDFVLRMINAFEPTARGSGKYRFSDLKYPFYRHPRLKALYLKSGRFKVYREQISSLYIYGYGQFRTLFLRVGGELCRKGLIERSDDIFYLSLQEIESILDHAPDKEYNDFAGLISQRKKEMEATRDLILPSVIVGENAPILPLDNARNYTGIGTSPGVFSGKTTVVRGLGDFSAVTRGDVLLIPFSDVSWTPVLARAGAIVSESGGMLSHCSIIARELGIPALVSVENACALGTGLSVTVDGSNGILTVHDHE